MRHIETSAEGSLRTMSLFCCTPNPMCQLKDNTGKEKGILCFSIQSSSPALVTSWHHKHRERGGAEGRWLLDTRKTPNYGLRAGGSERVTAQSSHRLLQACQIIFLPPETHSSHSLHGKKQFCPRAGARGSPQRFQPGHGRRPSDTLNGDVT